LVEQGGHDGRAIANYMLQFAMGRDIPLTNLQLQKIIFFAHGTYLTQFNSPLVINRFEAWEHGPVIPELYHALKQHGDRNIKSVVTRYDLESRSHIVVTADLPEEAQDHVAEMLLFYGRMNPWELVRLSHVPDGPWARTLQRAKKSANFSLVIDPQAIRDFFDKPRHNLQ
jgi:uncharacterized phage-associated protein